MGSGSQESSYPTCSDRWMREESVAGLVTVVVTTFNRASLVPKALDSVWKQAYRPIQLIVVVDGSTDNTSEVLERWSGAHGGDRQFSTRLVFQQNRGLSGARNRGLIESHGEFIQFLDDDDLLGPKKLASQVNYMNSHPECDMTYSATYTIGDQSRTPNRSNQAIDRDGALRYLVRSHFFNNICPMFRRRVCFRAGPWHEQMAVVEDYEYFTRLLCLGITFAYVPEAECFIQPYDGNRKRLSFAGEPDRRRDYYHSRFIHLDCLWSNLPEDLRKQPSWRRAVSKELLAVSKELLLLGDAELGKRGVRLSREAGHGTSSVALAQLMQALVAGFGIRIGARIFATLQKGAGSVYRKLVSATVDRSSVG